MQLFSLAAILVPMWARVACFKGDSSKAELNMEPQKPRIAVMLVGKLLKVTPHGSVASFWQSAGNKNLIEMMTEESGEEPNPPKNATNKLLANQSIVSQLAFPDFDPTAWTDVGNTDIWENTKDKLLKPLSRFGQVDTYVCVSEAAGLSAVPEAPPEITQVFQFDFPLIEQYKRAEACVNKIKATGRKYDWWIKKRPDFFSFQEWPDVTKFDPDYIYTRYRLMAGLKGLTSHVMSMNYCESKCNGGGGTGYVNDDMLMVASDKLIDHVFLPYRVARFLPPITPSSMWVAPLIEGFYTQQVFGNRVLTRPLSLSGCPLHSETPHCKESYKCKDKGVPLDCGAGAITVDELHNSMRETAARIAAER